MVKVIISLAAMLFVVLAAIHPAPRTKAAPEWLALGDSYTIGESVEETQRYPEQAAALLKNDGISVSPPHIIAVTGWTTGNLLAALDAENPAPNYQVVTLLIGVNNQFQGRSITEYRNEFDTLLKKAIHLAGNRPSHVLVLSIPDYSVTPFGKTRDTAAIAAQIDIFNTINRQLSSQENALYLDITTESRKASGDASLIAADGLHFSGKEYAVWARMMEPLLREMLR